ncbi:tetratricopeptide repeat protein [bacterium]|nr:tetratricopeptide repeat protein [bacterium]
MIVKRRILLGITLVFLCHCSTLPKQTSPVAGNLLSEQKPSSPKAGIVQAEAVSDWENNQAQAAYHLGLGYLFWLNEEIDKALEEFKTALNYDPQSAFLNYNLGEKYYFLAAPAFFSESRADQELRQVSLEQAEYHLDNAFAIDPEDLDTMILLADVKHTLNKIGDSIKLGHMIIKKDPKNILNRLQLAEELIQLGQEREAIDVLKPLLTQQPDHPHANYLMGYCLVVLKRDKEALSYLETAYENNPYHSALVEMLGQIYESEDEYDKAAAMYKKISLVSPKDSLFYEKYVRMLLYQNEYNLAEKVMNEIIAEGVENSLYYYFLGLIVESRGSLEKARDFYQKAWSLNEADFRIPYKLSVIYYSMGEQEKSIQVLRDALSESPNNPWLYLFLGEAHMRIGQYDQALELFNQGGILVPEDTEFYLQKAVIFEKKGDFEQTEEMLLKVISLDEKHSEALNFLGYFYAERGVKLDRAEEYLVRALVIQPENGAYLDSLGWVYFKQGKLEKALEYLQHAAVRIEYKDAVVLDHLADAWAAVGCFETAVTLWRKVVELDLHPENISEKINLNSVKRNDPASDCPVYDLTSLPNPDSSETQVQP